MVSESAKRKKDYGLSVEALQVLKQTVMQIRDLQSNSKNNAEADPADMLSEDIANALIGEIRPNQFIKPFEAD